MTAPDRALPTALSERAASDLRFIRATMTQAASFTTVSGSGYVAIGCLALLAGVGAMSLAQPAVRAEVWITDAVVSVLIGLWSTARKAQRAGQSLLSGTFRKFIVCVGPAIAVGAVLTGVFLRLRAYADLPALWMLCYGAGLVAGGAFSVRAVPAMGACFMTLGLTAALLSPRLGYELMTFGFAGLHIVFGVLVIRRHGG